MERNINIKNIKCTLMFRSKYCPRREETKYMIDKLVYGGTFREPKYIEMKKKFFDILDECWVDDPKIKFNKFKNRIDEIEEINWSEIATQISKIKNVVIESDEDKCIEYLSDKVDKWIQDYGGWMRFANRISETIRDIPNSA